LTGIERPASPIHGRVYDEFMKVPLQYTRLCDGRVSPHICLTVPEEEAKKVVGEALSKKNNRLYSTMSQLDLAGQLRDARKILDARNVNVNMYVMRGEMEHPGFFVSSGFLKNYDSKTVMDRYDADLSKVSGNQTMPDYPPLLFSWHPQQAIASIENIDRNSGEVHCSIVPSRETLMHEMMHFTSAVLHPISQDFLWVCFHPSFDNFEEKRVCEPLGHKSQHTLFHAHTKDLDGGYGEKPRFWKDEEGHWYQAGLDQEEKISEEDGNVFSRGVSRLNVIPSEMMQRAIEGQEKFLKALELSGVVPEQVRLRIQDVFMENRSLPAKPFEEYTEDEKKDLAAQENAIVELSQELNALDEQRFHEICEKKYQAASNSDVESLVA
jgi:hypothetical protein